MHKINERSQIQRKRTLYLRDLTLDSCNCISRLTKRNSSFSSIIFFSQIVTSGFGSNLLSDIFKFGNEIMFSSDAPLYFLFQSNSYFRWTFAKASCVGNWFFISTVFGNFSKVEFCTSPWKLYSLSEIIKFEFRQENYVTATFLYHFNGFFCMMRGW